MMVFRKGRLGRGAYSLSLALGLILFPASAWADAFEGYGLVDTLTLPAGTGPFTAAPDGRIVAMVGDEVHLETAAGSGSFVLYGILPAADIPFFSTAFISFSPDGTKMAVGNNGGASFGDFRVGVFDFSSLTGTWFSANHFLGVWLNNTQLALAASDFTNGSSVTLLDTTSADPLNPINPVLIDQIGGASGGLVFDATGRLYTGNGFTSIGPSDSGTIKAFTQANWMNAITSGLPINFETEGTFIIDLLGASPIGFDIEGNLFTGGGSAAPELDAVGVVRASAVANAVMGGGSIDPTDLNLVRRLDPIPLNDMNFFDVVYNATSGELYVRDFGDSTVYVYRDLMGVPAVSTWGLITLTLLMTVAGTLVLRQRSTQLLLAVNG